MHRVMQAGLVVMAWAVAAGCSPMPAGGYARGEVLYATCIPCHGENAEGKKELAAPTIAGLPAWYVKAQLNKFRSGARGAHAADAEGLRMRPMAQALTTDLDVESVAEFVSRQEPPARAPTVKGDVASGQRGFAPCAACHGAMGHGNQALGAPPLLVQPDWYLEAQLFKFRHGIRGVNPLDNTGMVMRPMALTIRDDATVRDIVSHISTFTR